MSSENTPLDPYKSPQSGGSRSGGSRVRSARYAMYGAYLSMATTFSGIYTMFRLIGDHFFGLVKSNETAAFYAKVAAGGWHIAVFVGMGCSVYSLYFGTPKIRSACIIPAIVLTWLFLAIAREFVRDMLDWL